MPADLLRARLGDAEPGADLSAPDLDDSSWLEVDVPGDLHRTLQAAGRLPVLDHGRNTEHAAWVEEREWWYRFALPEAAGPRRLVCEGLDTFATLFLDGTVVARSSNMFLPVEVEVPSGARVLAICFHRPQDHADGVGRMRKAQYGYGWDFAPRRPTLGPWQPVRLDEGDGPSSVRVVTRSLDPLRVEVTLVGPAGVADLRLGQAAARVAVGEPVLLEPGPLALWSPETPVLHDLTVTSAEDEVTYRIGARTIDLVRDDTTFRFVLNGDDYPVRGANWVPADTALGAVDRARVTSLLEAAKDAHMTMIRVWGGGVYESDHFYDECDRLGLLVWQDFMFACADYDDSDPGYVALVRAEARHHVRRLRHHASLALWCGNNEVEMLASVLDWSSASPAHELFHTVLAEVVADEDGATPYIPTSPTGGDRHYWQVWHGLPDAPADNAAWALDGRYVEPGSPAAQEFAAVASPDRYAEDLSGFTSEYGLCGALSWHTLVHWTDPADLVLGHPAVTHRGRPGRLGPVNKHDLLLASTVGMPTDLRDWVELSQLMQAEGDKAGAEHYRRRWPECGGSLVWQLNDCWPATSWALIDVDGRRKAAYHAVRRAFAPTLASFARSADGWELWLSTDVAWAGDLTVVSRAFEGEIRWQRSLFVAAEALSSQRLAVLDDPGDPRRSYLTVVGEGLRNRQLLAPYVALERTPVPPRHEVTVEDGVTTVSLTARELTLLVEVSTPQDCWSDAFFDLDPGQTTSVRATGVDPASIEVRYR